MFVLRQGFTRQQMLDDILYDWSISIWVMAWRNEAE